MIGRADVDPSRITARASGVAGVASLLAAAVNPQIASVSLDRTPHSVRAAIDSPMHTNLHDAVIPGFAVKWDLADLRECCSAADGRCGGTRPTGLGNVVRVEGDFKDLSSDPNVSR